MLKTVLSLPFTVVFYIRFWLLLLVRQFRQFFAVLFLASLMGCASTASIEKSPCACDFEPINSSHDGGQHA